MKSPLKVLLSALGALIALAALGVSIYAYIHPALYEKIEASLPFTPKPCTKPLLYGVGAFDARFGITKEEFAQDTQEAANIWNIAVGHTVLQYDPSGASATLPINLVYDQREATIQLGSSINAEHSTYEERRAALDAMRTRLNTAKQDYAAKQAAFEAQVQNYQSEVSYWNARGGAPQSEYAKLSAEQSDLNATQASLNQQALDLNQLTDQFNQAVADFNQQAAATNQQVANYNSEVGADFNEGEYTKDTSGTTKIAIYAFGNRGELIHVLAHEFGHSLGLGHNENPASIMYPYSKGEGATLSADDLAALKTACEL